MRGVPDGYRGFLGLASHEYFHSWHVKRIKPQAFAPCSSFGLTLIRQASVCGAGVAEAA